jgi:hypothetical protein
MFKETMAGLPIRKKEIPPTENRGAKKVESQDLADFLREDKSEGDPIKKKLLAMLTEHKIMENIDGSNVFDLEKFLASGFLSETLQHTYVDRQNGRDILGSYKLMFEKLSDLKVVSKQDYELQKDGAPREISLFNVPDSIEDAFNVKEYKNQSSDYYLNYWDLYEHTKRKQIYWNYKIKAKNGEEIGAAEYALAMGIYRDFGGRRDEEGNLWVWDNQKNKDVIMSVMWIKNNIGLLGGTRENSSSTNPAVFLPSKCPNMLERELLKLEDFGIKTGSGKMGELIRKEFQVHKKSPFVSINSVRYYIGRDFFRFGEEKVSTKNLKIIILDGKTAGIFKSFKGKDDLIFTIHLFDETEKEAKRELVALSYKRDLKPEEISAMTTISKEEVAKLISPWQATKDNPKRKDESSEEYAERIRRLSDWRFIQQVSDDFTKECQMGIHNLGWREQQWLASAAYELGKNNHYSRLLEFGKRHGLAGLKTFLSCEFDIRNGNKILSIGEKLGQEDAQKVFAKVVELVNLAEKENEELIKMLFVSQTDVDMSGAKFDLLKKVQEIILKFSDRLGDAKNDQKEIEELLIDLEKTKAEIILFKNVFKQIKKEYPEMSFDYFKSLDLAFQGSDAITESDKETMIKILTKNYSDLNERKIALAGMEKGLRNQNTVFEILRRKGEIVSFLRFDRRYDEQGTVINSYFGSFNTDADFQGAAIGDVMLKECLNEEAESFTIEAHTVPHKMITSKYIEDAGFIVETIELNYMNTGKDIFQIKRDDRINGQYKYRGRFEIDIKKELGALAEDFTGSAVGKQFLKIGVDKLGDSSVLEKIKMFMEKHNLVITRYFPDNKKQPEYFVAVFEKKISEPATLDSSHFL